MPFKFFAVTARTAVNSSFVNIALNPWQALHAVVASSFRAIIIDINTM
jgi:hypothetical protein